MSRYVYNYLLILVSTDETNALACLFCRAPKLGKTRTEDVWKKKTFPFFGPTHTQNTSVRVSLSSHIWLRPPGCGSAEAGRVQTDSLNWNRNASASLGVA